MTTIRYSDIPTWLRDSDFYACLNSDEPDSHISVPCECFPHGENAVLTVNDLVHMFHVIRFWGVKHIPDSALEFCFANEPAVWSKALACIDIPEVKMLQELFRSVGGFALEAALQTERPEITKFWLSKYDANSFHGKNAVAQACRFGRLDLVQTLREKGFNWDSFAPCAAAQYGHIDILEYFYKHACRWKSDAYKYAIRGGQVVCLKYLFDEFCPWNENATLEFAVPAHYQHLAELSKENGSDQPWTDDWTIIPPSDGYLECFRYIMDKGCKISYGTCSRVCKYGLLDCLKLLHEYNHRWPYGAATVAAAFGHLDCLKFVCEAGDTVGEGTAEVAARHGQLDCLQYIILEQEGYCDERALLHAAAESESVECLSFVVHHLHIDLKKPEYGYGLNFVRSNVSTTQYLLNAGCPFSNEDHPCPNKTVDVCDDASLLPYLTHAVKHSWHQVENLCDFVEWCNRQSNAEMHLPRCLALIEGERRFHQL